MIELVVSMTVGVIVSGTATLLLWNASQQRAQLVARGELLDRASTAMERIIRHIREIRQDEDPGGPMPLLNGNAQVDLADKAELRFDNDGFRVNGDVLEITDDGGGSWHLLARDVQDLTFTYYGWNPGGSPPKELKPQPLSSTNRERIRRVVVELKLGRDTESIRLRTSVYLRNFMNEVENAP